MCEKQAAAVQSGRLKDSAARCKMQDARCKMQDARCKAKPRTLYAKKTKSEPLYKIEKKFKI